MKCLLAAVALSWAGTVPAATTPAAFPTATQDPAPKPAAEQGGIPECKEMKKTASGLEYGVLQKGRDEPMPTTDDKVEVHYTGWLLDGTKFDGSRGGPPVSFPVTGVIQGWIEGLQLMTPGAQFKFVIPAALGYGERGQNQIPPNSTLVFEVELLKVTPGPKMPKFRPAGKEQKELKDGVKYEVVKVGTGKQVDEKLALAFRYAVFNKEGRLLECTEQTNRKMSGSCATLPFAFLKELAPLCKVGDVVRLDVPKSALPNGRVDTVWEVELLGATPMPEVPKFREPDPTKIVTTQSGLIYEVIEPGTGAEPKATDTVSALYTGWLLDGKMFDSAHQRGAPSEFALNEVIKGWTEGLQLMKVGGKFLFKIPGELAYGPAGRQPTIPANATLVFLVELVEVKSAK